MTKTSREAFEEWAVLNGLAHESYGTRSESNQIQVARKAYLARDAEVAELRQQLAAAQADARRYRWLRASEMEFGEQKDRHHFWWKCANDCPPEKVDKLIDAAIAQQKQNVTHQNR